jgi:23S rRNA (cytidine1920-2'-O)/16S rRNA (cytidine1409-2'-O)-methyltransferase
MMEKKRLDLLMVDLGLAPSRSRAQELIQRGFVQVKHNGAWVQAKPSMRVSSQDILISENSFFQFSSRAGHKLSGALDEINLSVKNMVVLDVGQSTGGFTDCLLKRDVQFVMGIDVGADQLAQSLRSDQRVLMIEKLNCRGLSTNEDYLNKKKAILSHFNIRIFDLVVVDLSFISLKLCLPSLLGEGQRLLCLVKPQFEQVKVLLNSDASREQILEFYSDLISSFHEWFSLHGTAWKSPQFFPSQTPGKDGTIELFMYSEKVGTYE